MSAKKNKKTNKKIDFNSNFVINPLTGRPIRIGGKVYMGLVSDNILKKDPRTRKKSIIYDGKNANDVLKGITKEKDTNIRTRKDNKIIKYRRQIKREEVHNNAIGKALEVVKQNTHLFNEEMDDEELDSVLYNLVHQKMIDFKDQYTENEETKPEQPMKQQPKQKPKRVSFRILPEPDYEYGDTDESDYEDNDL